MNIEQFYEIDLQTNLLKTSRRSPKVNGETKSTPSFLQNSKSAFSGENASKMYKIPFTPIDTPEGVCMFD